jgi:predicted ATPase
VLWGLWAFYEVRGELQTGLELAEQFATLAQRCDDAALLLEVCYVLGDTFFWLGAFGRAREHAEHGVALDEPQHHHALAFRYGGGDPGIACRSFAALALWFLGYPDQALTTMQAALALARELSHPVDVAFTLDFAASLHTLRREGPVAQERAEAAVAVASEHDFAFWLAFTTILRGWAWAEQGDVEAGRAELRRGLAAYEAIGATLERPYWLALLAEASVHGGRYEEGLTALAGALAGVRNMGMSFFYEAELYRLKGELLLQQAVRGEPEAETCFRQALDIARRQEAKALELRAARSLARLWQRQGKRAEAYELLAPIYHWFTEGFDTADLQEAKTLLEDLST